MGTTRSGGILYKGHPLPADCPPVDASDAGDGIVLRLVVTDPPTASDFLSGHVEGKTQPKKCDDCRWRACSVWDAGTPYEVLSGLAKLPNLRDKKFIARVKVSKQCGRLKPFDSDPRHMSFWMRQSFLPEKAIDRVDPL
jgi:hypothetical protein